MCELPEVPVPEVDEVGEPEPLCDSQWPDERIHLLVEGLVSGANAGVSELGSGQRRGGHRCHTNDCLESIITSQYETHVLSQSLRQHQLAVSVTQAFPNGPSQFFSSETERTLVNDRRRY
jgi:hypothetical protein